MSDTHDSDGNEKFRHVEIEILSACDVNCPMCDRFSDVAVGASMTVRQIEHFIEESKELNWPWERVRILGGEPTIHPKIRDMVDLLAEYRKVAPIRFSFQLLSNGHGKLRELSPFLRDSGVEVRVMPKDGTIPAYFDNMWQAPIDTVPGPQPPCGIFGIRACGIGLTVHGYYPCGAGGSIARVSGQDIAIRSLKDLTYKAAYGQTESLCNLCGHAVGWSRHQADGSYAKMTFARGPFWAKAIKEYKERKVRLPLYGQPA